MTIKLFVFLVSDDENFIAQHKALLSRETDLNVHRSAADCRNALSSRRPDLILLDAGLPDDDAFKLNRELRDDFDLADLYQVLIGTADDLARDGVEADDLLVKPVHEPVLRHKLALLGRIFSEKAAVRDQMAYAQNVAFTSMSAMGELGVVMQFLSKSFGCHNIQSVAALAIESLRQYELLGAVYIVWEGDGIAQTTEGTALPESQRSLIEQRRTLGRILEIDRNLVVNFDHVTVLVSNLPEDDAQRLGRIRDNIATLAEGIESRIAGKQLTPEQARDPSLRLKPMNYEALKALVSNFDFDTFYKAMGLPIGQDVYVLDDGNVRERNAILGELPLADAKVLLQWDLLRGAQPYLTPEFIEPSMEFSRVLYGNIDTPKREKLVANSIKPRLGHAEEQGRCRSADRADPRRIPRTPTE